MIEQPYSWPFSICPICCSVRLIWASKIVENSSGVSSSSNCRISADDRLWLLFKVCLMVSSSLAFALLFILNNNSDSQFDEKTRKKCPLESPILTLIDQKQDSSWTCQEKSWNIETAWHKPNFKPLVQPWTSWPLEITFIALDLKSNFSVETAAAPDKTKQ